MLLQIPETARVLVGRSPIVGVPAEAESASRVLFRMQQELDNSYTQIWQSVVSLGYLQSIAVTKISEKLESRLLPGAAKLSDDLSIMSTALQRYAEKIEWVHEFAQHTIADVEGHLVRIRLCSGELWHAASSLGADVRDCVPSSWEVIPSLVPPKCTNSPSTLGASELTVHAEARSRWLLNALAWGRAVDRVHECRARWQTLITERRGAEEALVARLNQTQLGSFLSYLDQPSQSTISRIYTGEDRHHLPVVTDPRLESILSDRLTTQQVSEVWAQLGLSETEIAQLPIEVLFGIAVADGVPFAARHIASVTALNYALAYPDEARQLMGLGNDVPLPMFEQQMKELNEAFGDAMIKARTIPGEPTVQFIGFGTHDGALTAAMSLGDVDSASHVGINVPGMGSSVDNIWNNLEAAEQLYLTIRTADGEVRPAVITWVGYRPPAMPPSLEVVGDGRASSGAVPLARFIDGVNAVRSDCDPALQRLVVVAHSYGSTTAAEALQFVATGVDAFVTYGSAGLRDGIDVSELRTAEVHSTMAGGDNIAGLGTWLSGRTNPIALHGVNEFSAEGDPSTLRVTTHSMFTAGDDPTFWNWGGEVGYLTVETGVLEQMSQIFVRRQP